MANLLSDFIREKLESETAPKLLLNHDGSVLIQANLAFSSLVTEFLNAQERPCTQPEFDLVKTSVTNSLRYAIRVLRGDQNCLTSESTLTSNKLRDFGGVKTEQESLAPVNHTVNVTITPVTVEQNPYLLVAYLPVQGFSNLVPPVSVPPEVALAPVEEAQPAPSYNPYTADRFHEVLGNDPLPMLFVDLTAKKVCHNQQLRVLISDYLTVRELEVSQEKIHEVVANLERIVMKLFHAQFDQDSTQEVTTFEGVIADKLQDFSNDLTLIDTTRDHSGRIELKRYYYNGELSVRATYFYKSDFVDKRPEEIKLDASELDVVNKRIQPVFIVDIASQAVLHANPAMEQLLDTHLTSHGLEKNEENLTKLQQELFQTAALQAETEGNMTPWESALAKSRAGIYNMLWNFNRTGMTIGVRPNQLVRVSLSAFFSFGKEYVEFWYNPEAQLIPDLVGELTPDTFKPEQLSTTLGARGDIGMLIEADQGVLLYTSAQLDEVIDSYLTFRGKPTVTANSSSVKATLVSLGQSLFQDKFSKLEPTGELTHATDMTTGSKFEHFAGRPYQWHSLLNGEIDPFEKIELYYGRFQEKHYLYMLFRQPNRGFPPFVQEVLDYSNVQEALSAHFDHNPCVIVDLQNFTVAHYNEEMNNLISWECSYCSNGESKTPEEHGELSHAQILQRLVYRATTSQEITWSTNMHFAYDRLTALGDLNPIATYAVSPFQGYVKYDHSDNTNLISANLNLRCVGCNCTQNAKVTLKRFFHDGRYYATLSYQRVPVYKLGFYPFDHIAVRPSDAFIAQHLTDNDTPALIADCEHGFILGLNQRLQQQLDVYQDYIHSHPSQPSYAPKLSDYRGHQFFHLIREYYITEQYNPLTAWDKTSTLRYPIYDHGINRDGERFISNCFDQSVQVTLSPVTEGENTFVLCQFTPLTPLAPVAQAYTQYQGMRDWLALLSCRENSQDSSPQTVRLDGSQIAQLINSYYQGSGVFYLGYDTNQDTWYRYIRYLDQLEDQSVKAWFDQILSNEWGMVRQWMDGVEKRSHQGRDQFTTGNHFQTGFEFIDFRRNITAQSLRDELSSNSNTLSATVLGYITHLLQPLLTSEPLTSLGLCVTYDKWTGLYYLAVILNPKYHLYDNFGQEELLYSVTRAMAMERVIFDAQLNEQSKLEISQYWSQLLDEISSSVSRLREQYRVREGESESEPLSSLVPLWKSKKPKQMGVVLTSLADTWDIPDHLLSYTKNGKTIPLSARRYVGTPPVFACMDWPKNCFEALVNEIEANAPQDEIVGHAWSSGYYWVGKLLEDSQLLQFIKRQKEFCYQNWEVATNPHLSKLLYDLSTNQYHVLLQPQILLKKKEEDEPWECHGAEALIRRSDNTVFPDEFVPLFEEQGIIRHIDLFVLEIVCQNLQKWKAHGKEMRISVNLSRITLMEPDIVTSIIEICDRYEISHDQVMMEVTERVGLIESEVSTELVQEFRDNGFKISLDDFGSASSNLAALSKISVDEVKVDKGLVDYIAQSENTDLDDKVHSMVRNIISMCREFEYDTITLAEGIEYIEQVETLRRFKCMLGQGFYFDRPLSIEDFYQKYILEA